MRPRPTTRRMAGWRPGDDRHNWPGCFSDEEIKRLRSLQLPYTQSETRSICAGLTGKASGCAMTIPRDYVIQLTAFQRSGYASVWRVEHVNGAAPGDD